MELQKGMIVSRGDWWYVVVRIIYDAKKDLTWLYCICDNANNIMSYTTKDITNYLTLKEIGDLDWGEPDREIPLLAHRDVPYQVITEVLAGRHDHRFDHWDEEIRP